MSRKTKLGKRVLSGELTVDEARAMLGRKKAQKNNRNVVKSAAPVLTWANDQALRDAVHFVPELDLPKVKKVRKSARGWSPDPSMVFKGDLPIPGRDRYILPVQPAPKRYIPQSERGLMDLLEWEAGRTDDPIERERAASELYNMRSI